MATLRGNLAKARLLGEGQDEGVLIRTQPNPASFIARKEPPQIDPGLSG
jgi:hypothetical protein